MISQSSEAWDGLVVACSTVYMPHLNYVSKDIILAIKSAKNEGLPKSYRIKAEIGFSFDRSLAYLQSRAELAVGARL